MELDAKGTDAAVQKPSSLSQTHAATTALESDLVYLGVSLIHPRGATLARTPIFANDWVARVEGTVVDAERAEGSLVYVVRDDAGKLIARDLTDPFRSNWTRYIQGTVNPSRANVSLRAHSDGEMYVQATKDIAQGEELLLDFGPTYNWAIPRPVTPTRLLSERTTQ
jgi:hypothetical protein